MNATYHDFEIHLKTSQTENSGTEAYTLTISKRTTHSIVFQCSITKYFLNLHNFNTNNLTQKETEIVTQLIHTMGGTALYFISLLNKAPTQVRLPTLVF